MPVFDPSSSIRNATRVPTKGPASTFGENFSAAFDAFAAGQQTFSIIGQQEEQVQAIRDALVERGVKSDRLGSPGSSFFDRDRQAQTLERFFERVREATADQPDLTEGLPTSVDELNEKVASEIRSVEGEAADVAFRAGTSGQVGGFLGAAAAATTDPPILASMMFGASAASGILRTAAIEAGIAGATEVPVQAAVQSQRSEVGLDGGVDQAINNVALAAVGGGIFGAGIKAVGRGISAGADAVRNVRARREADLARDIPPERIEVNEDLKGAVNNTIRRQEVQERNPFVDVPSANRRYQKTFDDLLRTVQDTGRVSPRSIDLPLRQDVARNSFPTGDFRVSMAAAAARGAGGTSGPREAANMSEAGAALGERIRELADAEANTPAARQARAARAINQEIDASGRADKVLDTLRTGAELDAVARRVRNEAPSDEAAKETFRGEFRTRFPDATDKAADEFFDGQGNLAGATAALKEVDSSPRQAVDVIEGLRRSDSIEEAVASGRSRARIEQERADAQAILENQADAVATMRQSIADDVAGDTPLRVIDDNGNIQTTTARAVLDDLDGDEALVRETQACLRGNTA